MEKFAHKYCILNRKPKSDASTKEELLTDDEKNLDVKKDR